MKWFSAETCYTPVFILLFSSQCRSLKITEWLRAPPTCNPSKNDRTVENSPTSDANFETVSDAWPSLKWIKIQIQIEPWIFYSLSSPHFVSFVDDSPFRCLQFQGRCENKTKKEDDIDADRRSTVNSLLTDNDVISIHDLANENIITFVSVFALTWIQRSCLYSWLVRHFLEYLLEH